MEKNKNQSVVFEISKEKEPVIVSAAGGVKMILGSFLLSPRISLQASDTIEILEALPLNFPNEKYLTVQEAERRTGISASKLRQMCRRQTVECAKFGKIWMISTQSLREYTKSN